MHYKSLLWMGSVVTGLFLSSCVSNETTELDERFAKNCDVIRANNAGWTGENLDYSMYADDFFMVNCFNGSPDTLRLATQRPRMRIYGKNMILNSLKSQCCFLGGFRNARAKCQCTVLCAHENHQSSYGLYGRAYGCGAHVSDI